MVKSEKQMNESNHVANVNLPTLIQSKEVTSFLQIASVVRYSEANFRFHEGLTADIESMYLNE